MTEPAPRAPLRATLVRLAGALVVLGVLALAASLGFRPSPAPEVRAASAFRPADQPRAGAPTAQAVQRGDGTWLTARVVRRTALRARPAGQVLARLGPRTEFGSARVLGVVRASAGWVRVVASELANGRTGWVASSDVVLERQPYALEVQRSARRLILRRGSHTVLVTPVAVGRPGAETPLGRFAVTDKLSVVDPSSPYGCCAIALSAHQPNIPQDWTGGDRVAIHATRDPGTIGAAVSLGCIRASDRAMRRLMGQVPLGAPVWVRP